MVGVVDFKQRPIKQGDSYLMYDFKDFVAEFVSVKDILWLKQHEPFSCRPDLGYPFTFKGNMELHYIMPSCWYRGYIAHDKTLILEDNVIKFGSSVSKTSVEIAILHRSFRYLLCEVPCYLGDYKSKSGMQVTIRHVYSYCNLAVIQVTFFIDGLYKTFSIDAMLVFSHMDYRYLGCVLEHETTEPNTVLLPEGLSCYCVTPLSAGYKSKLGLIGGTNGIS